MSNSYINFDDMKNMRGMMGFLNMAAAMAASDPFHTSGRSGLSAEEEAEALANYNRELELQKQEKHDRLMESRGLKLFILDGHEIWAINEKTAHKKAAKLNKNRS